MTTMIMTFVVPQRVTRATKGRARSLLRVSRRLTDTFRAPLAWTRRSGPTGMWHVCRSR